MVSDWEPTTCADMVVDSKCRLQLSASEAWQIAQRIHSGQQASSSSCASTPIGHSGAVQQPGMHGAGPPTSSAEGHLNSDGKHLASWQSMLQTTEQS